MKKRFLCFPLTALLLLLAAGPALAQSGGAEEDEMPSLGTSLTVGYFNTAFSYGGNAATAYDFDGPLASLMLNWQNGSLGLSYGTADATSAWPALRTAAASLRLGGDVYLFRSLFEVPLAVYVPLRLDGKYRYASLVEGDALDNSAPAPPTLHLGGAGLGAGGGARFAFPFGPSFVEDNLVAQASYVLTPGLMSNMGEDFAPSETFTRPLDEWRLRWSTDLSVEIQLKNLLNDSVGIAAGYTLRTVSRSSEKPGAAADVLDAFASRDNFIEVSDQHVFRIGIVW